MMDGETDAHTDGRVISIVPLRLRQVTKRGSYTSGHYI